MTRKTYVGLKAWDMGFDAHLTLIYTGKVNIFTEQVINDVIHSIGPITTCARRDNIEMFGPYFDIPVIKVTPASDLYTLFDILSKEIVSRSEYKWNPHITLDLKSNDTIRLPKEIKLTNLGFY